MLNESVKPASESRITKEVIGLVEYEVEEGNQVYWGHAQELLFEINRLNERNAKLVHENDELMAEVIMLRQFQKSTDEIIGDYEEKFTKQNEEICRMQDEISNLRGENNHE